MSQEKCEVCGVELHWSPLVEGLPQMSSVSDCRHVVVFPAKELSMTPIPPIREIPLANKGQIALVEESDYERISAHKWRAQWNKRRKVFYAVRNMSRTLSPDKNRLIYMHREVLGLEVGDPRQGDHKNMNTLDNRRENLRICTNGENQRNKGRRPDGSSPYKGVSFDKASGRWRVQITTPDRRRIRSLHDTPEQAYEVYCEAAIRYHGEFVRLA